MDIDDIPEEIQRVTQTAQLTKPLWQGLPNLIKGWGARKQTDVLNHRELVRDLLRENARDTLASLDLTIEAVFHILGPGFDSEDVIDPTWQKRWIEGAANVAADDEERRTWWSRLLAGEIQNPGSYSIRTLSIMDTLSPTEAHLFRKICSCVWRDESERPALIMPNASEGETWGMTFQQAEALEETGLVSMPALGYHVQLTIGQSRRFQNGDLDLFISPTAEKTWEISTASLTSSGRELLELVDVDPDPAYLREVIAELKKHANVHHAIRTQKGWVAGDEVTV